MVSLPWHSSFRLGRVSAIAFNSCCHALVMSLPWHNLKRDTSILTALPRATFLNPSWTTFRTTSTAATTLTTIIWLHRISASLIIFLPRSRYFITAESSCSVTEKAERGQNVATSHELNITRVNPTYQGTMTKINTSQFLEVGRLNVMLAVCGPITIMARRIHSTKQKRKFTQTRIF